MATITEKTPLKSWIPIINSNTTTSKEASTTASSALSTANTAVSKADAAQSSADSAMAAATAAQSRADTAATAAERKATETVFGNVQLTNDYTSGGLAENSIASSPTAVNRLFDDVLAAANQAANSVGGSISNDVAANLSASISALNLRADDIEDSIEVLENPVATGSTTARTLQDRFADVVNVCDFGAVGDGAADDTAAFEYAVAVGKSVYFPDGVFEITARPDLIIQAFEGGKLDGSVNINIPAGHYTMTKPWIFAASGGDKLSIQGAAPVSIPVSEATVSGTAGAWDITFSAQAPSAISVGDYALITADGCTEGTGAHHILRGVWKVVSVDADHFTVRCTAYCETFPQFSLTSGVVRILKTVIQWKDCDAIIVKSGEVGLIDNIAIVGNASEYWDADNIAGTEKGTHGVHVGNKTIAQEAGNPGLGGASLVLGTAVGVSDFDQQGIVASSGGSIFARWTASCSNRRRGYYAEACGSIQCKNSVGSGNWLDGYIADFGGAIVCNLSSACGNHGSGVYAINGGTVSCSNMYAIGNLVNGFLASGSSHIAGVASFASHNGGDGVHAENGAAVFADRIVAEHNYNDGFEATGGAVIRAYGASASFNTRYGFRVSSGGVMLNTSAWNGNDNAALTSAEFGYLLDSAGLSSLAIEAGLTVNGKLICAGNDFRTQNGTNYSRFVLTSIGDFVLGLSGTNWLTLKKATGALLPVKDNGQDIGSASLRFSQVYAATDTINTSDAREKTSVTDPDKALMRAWGKVNFKSFQFKDAVEKKDEDARIHFGVIAQQVQEAFESEGLDASRYALFCYDKWDDEYEDVEVVDTEAVLDEQGNEITPAVIHIEKKLITPAGDRYGIRYSEALALECAYQRWRLDKLEAQLNNM